MFWDCIGLVLCYSLFTVVMSSYFLRIEIFFLGGGRGGGAAQETSDTKPEKLR